MPKYDVSIYEKPSKETSNEERIALALEHIAHVLSVQTKIMIDTQTTGMAKKKG
jgi:hypothetical protein